MGGNWRAMRANPHSFATRRLCNEMKLKNSYCATSSFVYITDTFLPLCQLLQIILFCALIRAEIASTIQPCESQGRGMKELTEPLIVERRSEMSRFWCNQWKICNTFILIVSFDRKTSILHASWHWSWAFRWFEQELSRFIRLFFF